MSFVRPEIKAGWQVWKQVVLGLAIAAFGLFGVFDWPGLGRYGGVIVMAMGGLIALDGWKRVRFPSGSGGPGVVEVRERRITYFSAGMGRAVSLDSLQRCEVHRNARGRITWVFYDTDGMMEVPGDAEGTDGLFDALVALPGVNYAQAQDAAQGQGPDIFLIWNRERTKLN